MGRVCDFQERSDAWDAVVASCKAHGYVVLFDSDDLPEIQEVYWPVTVPRATVADLDAKLAKGPDVVRLHDAKRVGRLHVIKRAFGIRLSGYADKVEPELAESLRAIGELASGR